jgi:hypothetical protein
MRDIVTTVKSQWLTLDVLLLLLLKEIDEVETWRRTEDARLISPQTQIVFCVCCFVLLLKQDAPQA